MTKIGLFATSFVASLPGAALAYLMVMAFLNYSGGGSIWTKGLAGMLLVIGGLLTVMPFGIIVFAGPKTEKAPKKAKEKSGDEDLVEAEADEEEGEALVEADEDESESNVAVTDENLEVFDQGTDEFAMTGEVIDDGSGMSSGEFDLGEDFDSAEADVLEVEDDDEPKKKKK